MVDLSVKNCDKCKNIFGTLYDGWRIACRAFPKGMPTEYYFEEVDVTKLKECNNGIGYELKKQ